MLDYDELALSNQILLLTLRPPLKASKAAMSRSPFVDFTDIEFLPKLFDFN